MQDKKNEIIKNSTKANMGELSYQVMELSAEKSVLLQRVADLEKKNAELIAKAEKKVEMPEEKTPLKKKKKNEQ